MPGWPRNCTENHQIGLWETEPNIENRAETDTNRTGQENRKIEPFSMSAWLEAPGLMCALHLTKSKNHFPYF